jgi:uncharacterized protein (DUF1684 family)
MDVQPYRKTVEVWRTHRLARLTAPDGWLSIVGLWWLSEGSNTVGSAAESNVILPQGPAHLGTIEVKHGRAVLRAEPGSGLLVDGEALPGPSVPLRDDAGESPTLLSLGTLTFYVIRREYELAVRVKDAESAAREAFAGIPHYPVDPAWRVESRFEPYDPARTAPVPTVLGGFETYAVPGSVSFEIDGREYRLDVFLERPEDDLFIVFGDLTNRDTTFGGGRYLYTPQAGSDGVVVLDFNRAYNPPCVFTPHATCPMPLPQNRLDVRIEAGEQRYEAKP